MASIPSDHAVTRSRRGLGDRLGDHGLKAITLAAALAAVVLLGAIVWKVMELAWPAISHYGLSFLTSATWDPVKKEFGALAFIYGTAVSSFLALLIATPLAIAIALWLSELAPRGARGVIGSLVEMLAAIPSVVLGLWGILVLGPYLSHHLEPWLHDHLGFLPIFGPPSPTGTGMFTAALIITIMIVPIIASICRELFLQGPQRARGGCTALGARGDGARRDPPGDSRDRRGDHSRPGSRVGEATQ
jgi:phosphate transport system permease protein